MNTAEFVAIQMAKRFTARKIPDLKHTQHCRRLTCISLMRGFEVAHSSALFDADWLYEGYGRFRGCPSSYYPNDVIPWETILEHG